MEERPDAIHFQTFIGGIPIGELSRLIYFSFSTLTSVGYGDAYPVHQIARSLAIAEALIGQLYRGPMREREAELLGGPGPGFANSATPVAE
jgi:hypothetical protein